MQARAPCMLPAVPRLRDRDHGGTVVVARPRHSDCGALWQCPDRDTATMGHCGSARPETQRPWGTVAVPRPRHSDRGGTVAVPGLRNSNPVHVYIYIYICMYICMYICIYIYIYIYPATPCYTYVAHAYAYTYTYTYTHT